jgi:hypothetical protein
MFAITDWNLNPNRYWYVKIAQSGPGTGVWLFKTQDDAQAGTNPAALNENLDFGSDVSVVLDPAVPDSISFFNAHLGYHLKISGADNDTPKIFQVAPFVDLEDITNSIYRSSALIRAKAVNEINRHTHMATKRQISLANHYPEIKPGDICRVKSEFKNLDALIIMEELTITGTENSLITGIESVEYSDLNYA